jgi:hypothetical protein
MVMFGMSWHTEKWKVFNLGKRIDKVEFCKSVGFEAEGRRASAMQVGPNFSKREGPKD